MDQYGKLVEFITLVAEMVPELMNYKQRAQLILGLRARVSKKQKQTNMAQRGIG